MSSAQQRLRRLQDACSRCMQRPLPSLPVHSTPEAQCLQASGMDSPHQRVKECRCPGPALTSGRSFLKRMLQRNAVSRRNRFGLSVAIRTFHSGPRFLSCGKEAEHMFDMPSAA